MSAFFRLTWKISHLKRLMRWSQKRRESTAISVNIIKVFTMYKDMHHAIIGSLNQYCGMSIVQMQNRMMDINGRK